MTRSKYNIFDILSKLKQKGIKPGKKQFQKLVYLIEHVGNVALGYGYTIHYYGPYSAALDNTLAELEGEGLFHYEYQGLSHLIRADDSDDFVKSDLLEEENTSIEKVIDAFGDKSPSDLELLTTTHYIYIQSNLPDNGEKSVVDGVKKIKGNKYSDDKIKNALKELELF
jgi:uncharacterized protein YwgA